MAHDRSNVLDRAWCLVWILGRALCWRNNVLVVLSPWRTQSHFHNGSGNFAKLASIRPGRYCRARLPASVASKDDGSPPSIPGPKNRTDLSQFYLRSEHSLDDGLQRGRDFARMHGRLRSAMLLSGVKRTLRGRASMSAYDPSGHERAFQGSSEAPMSTDHAR